MTLSTSSVDFVRGDATGLRVPAHGEALRSGGADYLTELFRAFGAIAPDNSVKRISRFSPCTGGSTGQKFYLGVEYARSDPELHTELFIKFSRDFQDQIRDERGKHELAGEVQLARLSRTAHFPINVPTAYFADYNASMHTGVLITEQIPFGRGRIEPHRAKCSDEYLVEPIEYYRVLIRSLARVAAAHSSGRFGAIIDKFFHFDPQSSVASCTILISTEELHSRIRRFAAFVEQAPQLFPPSVTHQLFDEISFHAARFVARQAETRAFMTANPDLIALCHWNANIDNAWFWRDDLGELHCGLMDWGHAGQMNLAFSLWGCLSGASLDVWDHHLDELIDLFIAEFAAHGGPAIAHDEMALHLDVYVAMMGLSYFIDSPARILQRLPAAIDASGPHDPVFRTSDTARNQLHISTAFLNLWQRHDFGASLDRALRSVQDKASYVARPIRSTR